MFGCYGNIIVKNESILYADEHFWKEIEMV
jgi:hypothetical protein